jgi:hypothetical protein
MVKRTAHNGHIIGSNPIKPMQDYFKMSSYKVKIL